MKTLLRFKWAVLLFVLGAGVLGWALWDFLGTLMKDPLVSFTAPGEATLKVAEPGDYVLWYQNQSARGREGPPLVAWNDSSRPASGSPFNGILPAGSMVNVTRMPEGTEVPVVADGRQTWTTGNTIRRSVARFTAAAPGDYSISVTHLPDQQTFCVSRDWFMDVFWRFFAGIAIGVLLILAAFVAGIVALVRLLTQRKAARAE
jgi:hypothetical protein